MPESFTYFGGIDFSGAKEPLSNLWSTVGREEDEGLTILSVRPHAFRQDLCSYVAGGWRSSLAAGEEERILWGADFPFGIPADAATHVCGEARWTRLLDWVADRPADEVRGAVPEEMRGFRLTDQGGALSPFDVRLYKQTTEGLRWLQQLRDSAEVAIYPQQPDESVPNVLIEVYPSSSAQELGLPRRRAPSRPGEIRARAAALRTYLRFADPGDEVIAVTLEDAWDATIACLTAWLARDDLHQPFRATDHPRDRLELEGWIYRPPATLG